MPVVMCLVGSSPLARGAPAQLKAAYREDGLIPAGAGSTCLVSMGRRCGAAHPRWRGEHVITTLTRRRWNGSSPLARGAHGLQLSRGGVLRLIPAGAGSTVAR